MGGIRKMNKRIKKKKMKNTYAGWCYECDEPVTFWNVAGWINFVHTSYPVCEKCAKKRQED